jgi:hypothetical protein
VSANDFQLLSQPRGGLFFARKRVLVVAGKRQLVRMLRIVDGSWTMDTLSVVHEKHSTDGTKLRRIITCGRGLD